MNFRHGMNRTTEHMTWSGMKSRCDNKLNPAYKNYGGRGITYCDRWKDFKNFLEDMGTKPRGYTLERLDNDKGYSPENCEWVPKAQQSRNKRDNIIVEINGERKCLAEWAREYGIPYKTANMRIRKGWPPVDAVTVPLVTKRAGVPRGQRIYAFAAERGVVFGDEEKAA